MKSGDGFNLFSDNTDTLRQFLVANNFFPRKKVNTSIKIKMAFRVWNELIYQPAWASCALFLKTQMW